MRHMATGFLNTNSVLRYEIQFLPLIHQAHNTRSASKKTAHMAERQQFVRNSLSIQYPANPHSPYPPSPFLELPTRMRLHLPAHNHRPTRRILRAYRAIPRKVALLPLLRHARAILRLLLSSQFPRTPKRALENHLQHPSLIHIAQILRSFVILWNG